MRTVSQTAQHLKQQELLPHLLQCLHLGVDDESWHSTGETHLTEDLAWQGSPRVPSKLLCGAGLDPQYHLQPCMCWAA